jgi:hypothetical protein
MDKSFARILDKNMHGWTKTKGDYRVEVVRCYENDWAVFRWYKGKIVKGKDGDGFDNLSMNQATKLANEFCRGEQTFQVWE